VRTGISKWLLGESQRKDDKSHQRETDEPADVQELRKQVSKLRELAVLSLLIHSAGTSTEIITLFLERSPNIAGAKVVYPLLLDKRRGVLHAKPLEGSNDARLDQASLAFEAEMTQLEFPLYLRSTRRIILEGGEVVIATSVRDLAEDVLGRQVCESGQKKLDIKKLALVPLVMNGEPLGLITFMFDHDDIDVDMLELLAGHCTLALKASLDQEESGRFSEVDEVTWLRNKRFFRDRLADEIVRAERYNRPVSVVLLDIDGFTAFNEGYGPSMGDKLLKSVAMTINSSLAEPEIAVRYGSDEFAIILPESNRPTAVAMTSKLIAQIGQVTVFGGDGPPEPVTAAVAIVSYPEDGANRDELVEALEASLTEAKRERDVVDLTPERKIGWTQAK
jgi:diguanylate cyclase (GGDEF)-like protein